MGDIAVQTVAGATQTGTHGTGRASGGISAQITALELVLANGSLVTCSAQDQPDLFAAAQVGLGALGIVTAVTFGVEPTFLLQAREEPMRWSQVISALPELASANEHFEFYWFPHSEGCLSSATTGPTARPARCRAGGTGLMTSSCPIRCSAPPAGWGSSHRG